MPDTHSTIWQPKRRPLQDAFATPSLAVALRRGLSARCPVCGQGRLFAGWLRISASCAVCAAPLGLIRADDAPPYFTVFIVAHVAIGALVALERVTVLSVATEMAILLPGTLALTLALMRPVKGATVGLMMRLGFMKPPETENG